MNDQNKWLVVENVPGYMPDDPEPSEFELYTEAVAHANDLAAELTNDGFDVEQTGDDPYTIRAHRPGEPNDLGRVIQVVPRVDQVFESSDDADVAAKVDEIVDRIERVVEPDELDEIADDLGIGVVVLVDRIANEIKARISGSVF